MLARDLLGRSRAELDSIYAGGAVPGIPGGDARGTAIVCPGSVWARALAWLVRALAWQGKVFDAGTGTLVNRVSPLGVRAIDARLRSEASWLDGKPCVVIDYSRSSWWLARRIRDEIREIEPGLWLGKVWWGRRRLIDFALAFRHESPSPLGRRALTAVVVVFLALALYLSRRLLRDEPVTYSDPVTHFKYGSTGGERGSGIPKAIWLLLPELFPEHLPGQGLASLGFVFEQGHDLPIGVSQRNVQGIERVFLNCAICHVGTVRMMPDGPRRIVPGMPSNTVDLQGFERFLFACAEDEKFSADRITREIAARESDDWLNRKLYRHVAVHRMREQLMVLRDRFEFMEREPDCGPGRVDTFNPSKALFNFPMDDLPVEEWVGLCDFPSIWNQGKRAGMQLHWDGNNTSVEERNRSAAFGTGATPATLDRPSIRRTEAWLRDEAVPPAYPGTIDAELAARGEPLYAQYCANCHGRSGSDFTGSLVGKVTPIEQIGTDRHRLDSYSPELCANQNLLYAAYPAERFKSFRKTNGYANQPLDGVWLRAPYLHNGSVPTLRELLEPSPRRRAQFYRGHDVYDPARMGFVADVAEEDGRRFFLFDTSLPGNGNRGHDGAEYGTELAEADKAALVEYLKAF